MYIQSNTYRYSFRLSFKSVTTMDIAEMHKVNSQGFLDDKIREMEEEIEKEVVATQVLVNGKEGVEKIQAEYQEPQSLKFLQKAKELLERYKLFRKIRGDGNCFYRAFIFAQFERMLSDPVECDRFLSVCEGWKQKLINLDFPKFTTEDFCDVFVEHLKRIENGMTHDELMKVFNDDASSNYLVVFVRLVTSGYLQEKQEFYANFVEGQRTVKEYCTQEIEPMWKVADHLSISAMVEAFGVPIRIEYMDQTEAPSGGWHHDFSPQGTNAEAKLFFLYRHDHYDILYKN